MPSLSKLIGAKADDGPGRRERRKEARPGELLDAALDLFVEKGFAATRAEEVAARAGVSKGTLFLYFQSKEELFKAVVRENIAGRFGAWNTELEQFGGSSPELLRFFMRMWWERVGATRAAGITKLMISESRNFPELAAFYREAVIQPGNQLIRRILQRGIDAGEFRPLDLDHAALAVTAPMIFLIMNRYSGACLPEGMELDAERYIDAQAEFLLRGFAAEAGDTKAPRARP